MGYKMLTGDVIVGAHPLMVRVTAEGCPLKKDRINNLKLIRCICYDNEVCEYFLAWEFIQEKGCVKCMHPEAKDAEEFKGWDVNQEETMTTGQRIITVGDVIRYKPTGHVDTVKAVYAGTMRGAFKCAGGTFRQARAILVLERDSGHYPVGDDIELLLPEDVDEEGRYPQGGLGRSRPTEHACGKCEPSRFPDKACWVWCHRHREHFAHGG